MSLLPIWARKPNHEKEVIATEKGWVVEETGEVLRSDRHLLGKLDKLQEEIGSVSPSQQASPEVIDNQEGNTLEGDSQTTSSEPEITAEPDSEPTPEEETPVQEVKVAKKKPGRPKKSESDNNKS